MKLYSTDIDTMFKLNLNHNIFQNNNMQYIVFQYDKELLCYNNEIIRNYKHVTIAYPEKNVLGFAPPHCNIYSSFKKTNTHFNNLTVNDYIDGTNICLFYDYRICKWKITIINTASDNYASDNYASDINVNRFISSLGYVDISDINDMLFIKELYKNCCFVFVINHNNITNISKSYLVSVYRTCNRYVEFIPATIYENWDLFTDYSGVVLFPKQYDITSYDELEYQLCNISDKSNGFMITNYVTGESCKLVSFQYSSKQTLQNINPVQIYRYLCLQRIDSVYKYLLQSKKDKNTFFRIRDIYEGLITLLHKAYIYQYVKKYNIDFCEKYFVFIYKIHHDIYLPSLKGNLKKIITRKEIKKYLNSLHPKEVFSLMT